MKTWQERFEKSRWSKWDGTYIHTSSELVRIPSTQHFEMKRLILKLQALFMLNVWNFFFFFILLPIHLTHTTNQTSISNWNNRVNKIHDYLPPTTFLPSLFLALKNIFFFLHLNCPKAVYRVVKCWRIQESKDCHYKHITRFHRNSLHSLSLSLSILRILLYFFPHHFPHHISSLHLHPSLSHQGYDPLK